MNCQQTKAKNITFFNFVGGSSSMAAFKDAEKSAAQRTTGRSIL